MKLQYTAMHCSVCERYVCVCVCVSHDYIHVVSFVVSFHKYGCFDLNLFSPCHEYHHLSVFSRKSRQRTLDCLQQRNSMGRLSPSSHYSFLYTRTRAVFVRKRALYVRKTAPYVRKKGRQQAPLPSLRV